MKRLEFSFRAELVDFVWNLILCPRTSGGLFSLAVFLVEVNFGMFNGVLDGFFLLLSTIRLVAYCCID